MEKFERTTRCRHASSMIRPKDAAELTYLDGVGEAGAEAGACDAAGTFGAL